MAKGNHAQGKDKNNKKPKQNVEKKRK